jgi:short-chain fatty acids transporter
VVHKRKQVSHQDPWITRFSRLVSRLVPDAISSSVLLLVLLVIVALMLGNTFTTTLDAYYKGLWMLLPFTMQMTLVLVLSSVLGATPFFRKIVVSLSRKPGTAFQVIVFSVLLSAGLAYLYWGLGLALAPLIAIYFCTEAERKGIEIDFPFFLSVMAASVSVWQYGLSASGPLLMATPGHFLETTTGVMALRTTIWSPSAIFQVVGFSFALIITARLLMPMSPKPISQFPESCRLVEPVLPSDVKITGKGDDNGSRNYSERFERNRFVSGAMCVALLGWLVYHFWIKRAGLDLNSLNTILLLLCFLLHRNVKNFSKALQGAVVSCWPVLVLYHLYAGVAGLIQFTTVGESFAGLLASISTRYTFPLLTAIAGTVVAVFVPSSGGQWVIQGFVTTKAAASVGVSAQCGMLALGVGDQMGNLLSPFWAVVFAGIARIDFRKFIGYSLIFALLWFVLGVFAFTFLPC